MSKSPQIEAYLSTIIPHRELYMSHQRCVSCGCHADSFKDDISAKEYTISGLCQECQDEAFAPYDEEEEEDPCNEQDWRADR